MSIEQRVTDLENTLAAINDVVARAQLSEPPVDTTDGQPQAAYGIYLGLCVDTLDIYKQNRIRFFSPLFHDPKINIKSLPFASPVSSMGGFDDCGVNWIPPAGSTIAFAYEGGNRTVPLYFGTTWVRNRGTGDLQDGGYLFAVPVPEYEELYKGRRGGYLCGPNNGSQVLPPWNTESYNGFDVTALNDIETDPDLLKRMTYPNIYGFKTPEKHMMKMVDGDARCARKWKRLEIMSGNGNWLCFKDDHLHYGGQWAHPFCSNDAKRKGDTSCVVGVPNPPPQTVFDSNNGLTGVPTDDTQLNIDDAPVSYGNSAVDINLTFGKQIENTPLPSDPKGKIPAAAKCWTDASGKPIKSSPFGPVIGGDPDYQGKQKQVGTNPFFKQMSECRPYRGPQTPQNNKCDLPQTGIQFLSISGHTFVMDDSVKDPRGGMEWDRGTQPFDFGCTDKYVGRTYWKSATGHMIELNDKEDLSEKTSKVRSAENGIKLRSALGNQIFLCDEMQGPKCPSLATENQGVRITSTSNHQIILSDKGNNREVSCRKENLNLPASANANGAYIKIRTGYGIEILMNDGTDQKLGKDQFFQISTPQRKKNEKGDYVENGNLLRFEDTTTKSKFILRSAGDFILSMKGTNIEIVGDDKDTESVGGKLTQVKDNFFEITKKMKYHENKQFFSWSKDKSFILAGQDYPPNLNQEQTDARQKAEEAASKAGTSLPPLEKVANICPVLVWNATIGKIQCSDRVFASSSKQAPLANIYAMSPYSSPQQLKDEIDKINGKSK